VTSRQKVLIVEDNADLRRLYAIGLNQRGYEVKLAANGAEALDRIEHEKPDVILLDLLMPVMDGWELIGRVNPDDQCTQIPIIVITGQAIPADHPVHPCVVGWVSKPTTIDELVDAILHSASPGANPSLMPPNGGPGTNHRTSPSG
jgi:CheY-like chemotaxis protein